MKTKNNLKYLIAGVLVIIVLLGIDRITKYLAVAYLKDSAPLILIPDALQLTYLENRGMAFGLLENKQALFIILTSLFLVIAIYCMIRLPKTPRYLPIYWCITGLIAGGIGNFFDRIVNRYVVDFIYFSLIDFPVFNVADICVTISMFVLLILLLFKYKENDFDVIAKHFSPSYKKTESKDDPVEK